MNRHRSCKDGVTGFVPQSVQRARALAKLVRDRGGFVPCPYRAVPSRLYHLRVVKHF